MSDSKTLTRRDFLKASGTAAAASLVAPTVLSGKPQRKRVAIVGTGIRGTTMYGRDVARDYAYYVELVGLCDINPGRVAFARDFIGVDIPTFTDFDRMIETTRPDTVVVTTVDSTHDEFIVRALGFGCDVVTEKPMTTDERKCQAILDAQARSGRSLTVTHNYRYSPHRLTMKQLLMDGRVGTVTSVDFHWYLDVYHGADYFRRWHGKRRFSGTLFVHKASHHFDLLNWWLDSEPAEVFARGSLDYYGRNNDFRHTRCRGCPFQSRCRHYWDISESEFLTQLYVANEHHDGYIRDGCVWSEEIDIYDKMSAQIRYVNGVDVSYSCTTYSPYEGYRIAFNGTRGRMETWIKERQPWVTEDHDEIRVTDNFGETEIIEVSHGPGGHGGGDARLLDRLFRSPTAPDTFGQAADARQGAMAVLVGIAARKSVESGLAVPIGGLTSLVPGE